MAPERSNGVTEVATARGRKIVIHNCLTKADLRSLFISHMGFQFAQATGMQDRMIELTGGSAVVGWWRHGDRSKGPCKEF